MEKLGSVLSHLVCRWDATFCSNKQKKQLSPFWSKIFKTIGGTIWSTSSIRCWAMWIAEFHKRLNASRDWLSGGKGVCLVFFARFLELSVYEQSYDQKQSWWQEKIEKKVLKSSVCYPVPWTTRKEQRWDSRLCLSACGPANSHWFRTIAGDSLCLWKTNWYPKIRFVFWFQAPHQLSHTEECSTFASRTVITVLFTLAISFTARTILYFFFSLLIVPDCFWWWDICPSRRTDRRCTGMYEVLLEN